MKVLLLFEVCLCRHLILKPELLAHLDHWVWIIVSRTAHLFKLAMHHSVLLASKVQVQKASEYLGWSDVCLPTKVTSPVLSPILVDVKSNTTFLGHSSHNPWYIYQPPNRPLIRCSPGHHERISSIAEILKGKIHPTNGLVRWVWRFSVQTYAYSAY